MTRRRRREGFLLPLVLVALLLVATIAGATGLSAWRAMRAARLAWNGERAAQAADEAIARGMAGWNAESFAARPLGARWSGIVSTVNGGDAAVSFVRLAPLAVAVEAASTSRVSGSPDTASRRVARVLSLEAPLMPVHGALTVLGDMSMRDGAIADGRDQMWTTDGCGPTRDTLSVPGVYAAVVSVTGSVFTYGAPAVVTLGGGMALDPERAVFQAAMSEATSRIARNEVLAGAGAMLAAPPWTARTVTSGDSMLPPRVVLAGSSSHDGLLVVNGDLVLHGALRVQGLLVVSGALDARDGTLDVDGAVLVRDGGAHGTHIGAGVRIRYSPCTVERALATIARPRIAPFAVWIAR